jgi:predicted metal-dependent hydrolase
MAGLFDDILEPPLEDQIKELKREIRKYIRENGKLEKELDLSNERNLRQSRELDQTIDLIDRLRMRVSDVEWEDCKQENKKAFEKITAELEEEDNG